MIKWIRTSRLLVKICFFGRHTFATRSLGNAQSFSAVMNSPGLFASSSPCGRQTFFFFFIALSDTEVYEPYMRALLDPRHILREADLCNAVVGERPVSFGRDEQPWPLRIVELSETQIMNSLKPNRLPGELVRQCKLPWREASPPNHLDDEVNSDQ